MCWSAGTTLQSITLSLVKRFCPRAAFIFDTVDLHYLREQRLADLEDSIAPAQGGESNPAIRTFRYQRIRRGTGGERERSQCACRRCPECHVHVLSNIHDVAGRKVGFEERSDLFFVGGSPAPAQY